MMMMMMVMMMMMMSEDDDGEAKLVDPDIEVLRSLYASKAYTRKFLDETVGDLGDVAAILARTRWVSIRKAIS